MWRYDTTYGLSQSFGIHPRLSLSPAAEPMPVVLTDDDVDLLLFEARRSVMLCDAL